MSPNKKPKVIPKKTSKPTKKAKLNPINKAKVNKLFYGDNLEVLRKYIRDETVDLCYIDPPFNSKRNYNQIYNNIGGNDKAQAQAFIDTWRWDDEAIKGFDEIVSNYNGVFTKQSIELIIGLEKVLGKGDLLAYLVSMSLRIAEIYRVLKPTGSFYLHCDPTASHYLKLVLDAIFCSRSGDYRNEIIWCYTGPGSPGMRQFMRKHDVVFWYSKSSTEWTFNRDDVRIPHSAKTKDNYKEGLTGSGFVEADHKIHEKGKVPEDWWEMAIAPRGKEYLGYPTQKPEKLLERIIRAGTNNGDLVLDAYCGCGTSVAVAEKLNRRWIGIDITYQSISLILKRLEDSFGKKSIETVELNGIPEDLNSAIALANKKEDKTRKEFEKWAVLTYSNNRAIINEKKGADGGIDGIAYMQDRNLKNDIEYKQVLFSVKSDKKPTVAYIRDFYGAIQREGAAMGYFISLYPPTKDMILECKKIGKYKNELMEAEYPKIKIITAEEILNGDRITIPTSQQVAVVKSSKQKGNDFGQEKLF